MGVVVGILLVLLSAGCASVGQDAQPELINFRDLAKGAFSAVSEPQQLAIKEPKKWDDFWARHSAASSGIKKPELDFSKEMVVALTLGRRNTGGYSIAVEKVEAREGKIVVFYSEREPRPGGITLQALSAPFHFAAIPKSGKPVEFQKVAPRN